MTKTKTTSPPIKVGSADTQWSTTQGRNSAGARYHGFPRYGDENVSYCGIDFGGLKRQTPPDRDEAVCEHCAVACGFVRRPGRDRSRRRGSRKLGTSVERLEEAVDRNEVILASIEAAVDHFNALLTEWKERSA